MGITRESTVTVVSSLAGLRSLSGGKLMPGPQRLGDGPRLRDAPAWCKRRIAIEDLGDRPEPVVAEVMPHWREEGYLGFLAGPPLIGVVAEAAGLVAGMDLVSGACAFVALKAGALPEASTPRNSVTAGPHTKTPAAGPRQETRLSHSPRRGKKSETPRPG